MNQRELVITGMADGVEYCANLIQMKLDGKQLPPVQSGGFGVVNEEMKMFIPDDQVGRYVPMLGLTQTATHPCVNPRVSARPSRVGVAHCLL